MIDEIIQHKPRLVLLNKADMADKQVTKEWIAYFQEKEIKHLLLIRNWEGMKEIVTAAQEILKEKFDRMKARGVNQGRFGR